MWHRRNYLLQQLHSVRAEMHIRCETACSSNRLHPYTGCQVCVASVKRMAKHVCIVVGCLKNALQHAISFKAHRVQADLAAAVNDCLESTLPTSTVWLRMYKSNKKGSGSRQLEPLARIIYQFSVNSVLTSHSHTHTPIHRYVVAVVFLLRVLVVVGISIGVCGIGFEV